MMSSKLSAFRDKIKASLVDYKTRCILGWPGWKHFTIWALGLLLMVALTIKDLVPVINDYNDNNIDYKMQIRTEPDPPEFTICLPFFSWKFYDTFSHGLDLFAPEDYRNGSNTLSEKQCWECPSLEKAGLAFWHNISWNTEEMSIYGVKAFLAREIHKRNPNYNGEDSIVLGVLADSVWVSLSQMYFAETALLNPSTGEFDKRIEASKWSLVNWLPRETVDLLYEAMLTYIEQRVTNASCLPRTSTDANPKDFVISPHGFRIRGPVVFASDKFCFPIRFEGGGAEAVLQETHDFQCSYLRKNPDQSVPSDWKWERYTTSLFEIYSSPAVLYSKVQSKDGLYTTSGAPGNDGQQCEYVYIKYRLNSKLISPTINKRTTCSNDTSIERCLARWIAETALVECGCIPFTYRYLLPAKESSFTLSPYCTTAHYKVCAPKLKWNSTVEEFCNYKCAYSFYDFEKEVIVETKDLADRSPNFIASFAARRTPYIEFSSGTKINFGQYVSQIGGVAGLYLGLSGFTLIALFIICLDQLHHWYQHPASGGGEEEHFSPSMLWSVLRMVGLFKSLGTQDQESTATNSAVSQRNTDLLQRVEQLEAKLTMLCLSQQSTPMEYAEGKDTNTNL